MKKYEKWQNRASSTESSSIYISNPGHKKKVKSCVGLGLSRKCNQGD